MRRLGIAVLLVALGVPSASVWSQTVRYPRVYGATGHLYGPTQAYYQYQRQYGHPWHGYGGITTNIGPGYVNGYPGAYLSSYGYNAYFNYGGCGLGYGGIIATPGYSPFPSYTPPVLPVSYGYPFLGYNNPLNNPALTVPQNNLGLNQPFNATPLPNANPLPPITTPEAKLKSVRAQAQGDIWFQKQEYHKAFSRYRDAVSEAQDRGEAHLRLAICYAALGHLDNAVRQIKLGMDFDPQFLSKVESLDKIFGPGNAIAQAATVHKATLWAKEDIRDPDRLFLLGAFLYLQGDQRAPILLETGMELAGGGEHFRGFLAAAQTAPLTSTEQADANGASQTPQPQANHPAPAPQITNPSNANSGALPPLPAPPARAPGDSQTPSGPDLPQPNG